MTYDPKFSVKQMYDQYGRSRNTTKTAGPKGFTKKPKRTVSVAVDTRPSRSSGFGGMGPDPAERFGGSPTRGLGSKPDYSSSAYDSGADNNPNKDEYESKGVIAKLYDRAVATFRNFGADDPEDVIVDGKAVYKGPMFRGYTPDTSNLFVDNNPNRDRRAVMPDSTVNIFGVNTDNPRLNMFGVERKSFRNPDPFIPPVLPESPANVDDVTRAISQGMRPEPTVIDGEPVSTIEVKTGQTLFDIRDQYNESTLSADKKITVEDIRRFNDIPLDGMFGIKPGTKLKLPIRRETEVDRLRRKVEQERSIRKAIIEFERLPEAEKEKVRDQYRLYEEAQPASGEFMDAETRAMLDETTPIKANYITESLSSLTGKLSKATKDLVNSYTTSTTRGLGTKDTSTYKVESGDTMYAIAKRQGVTLDKLMEANPNVDADKIGVGQVINIPRGAELNELPPDVQAKIATDIDKGIIQSKKDLTLKLYDYSRFTGIPPIEKGENLIEYFARSGLIGVDEADPQFKKAFKSFGTGINITRTPWCADLLGSLILKSGGSLPDRAMQYRPASQNYEFLGETIYNHNPSTNKTYKGKPSDVRAGDIIIFNNKLDSKRFPNGDFKYPQDALNNGLGAGHVSVVLEVRDDGSVVALGGNQSAGATSYITGGRSTGGIRASLYTPEVIKQYYKGGFKINRLTDTSLTQADPAIVAAIIKDAGLGGDGQ